MLEVAAVTKADVVYDLGCGDGRIPIAAATKVRSPGRRSGHRSEANRGVSSECESGRCRTPRPVSRRGRPQRGCVRGDGGHALSAVVIQHEAAADAHAVSSDPARASSRMHFRWDRPGLPTRSNSSRQRGAMRSRFICGGSRAQPPSIFSQRSRGPTPLALARLPRARSAPLGTPSSGPAPEYYRIARPPCRQFLR